MAEFETGINKGTVLIGMMDCGKTTLGKSMANRLGQKFTDTDGLLKSVLNLTPKEIKDDPAKDFAKLQELVVKTFAVEKPDRPEVIAAGDSVPMYPELMRHLGRFGLVVLIQPDVSDLRNRLGPDRIAALNNTKDLSFEELYAEREPMYLDAADLVLSVPVGEPPVVTLDRLVGLRQTADLAA
jgi:shikimate kinase